MTNLFLTLLDRMGVPSEKIGDSTGRSSTSVTCSPHRNMNM